MKNYDKYHNEKKREQQWNKEQHAGGFRCAHCKQWVIINEFMGTANRNHCNFCLWSKHVDEKKGDRKAVCKGGMQPIGITFKQEGYRRQGEIMLIHLCTLCSKISINRIAGDDISEEIMTTFNYPHELSHNMKKRLAHENIYVLVKSDRQELCNQLFGKTK